MDHQGERLCKSCKSFPIDKCGFVRGSERRADHYLELKLGDTLINTEQCFRCRRAAGVVEEFRDSDCGKGLKIDPHDTKLSLDCQSRIWSSNDSGELPPEEYVSNNYEFACSPRIPMFLTQAFARESNFRNASHIPVTSILFAAFLHCLTGMSREFSRSMRMRKCFPNGDRPVLSDTADTVLIMTMI